MFCTILFTDCGERTVFVLYFIKRDSLCTQKSYTPCNLYKLIEMSAF